jgi:hypothetical protein
VRQEMKGGKMIFTSWTKFMDEFALMFCPENKATCKGNLTILRKILYLDLAKGNSK